MSTRIPVGFEGLSPAPLPSSRSGSEPPPLPAPQPAGAPIAPLPTAPPLSRRAHAGTAGGLLDAYPEPAALASELEAQFQRDLLYPGLLAWSPLLPVGISVDERLQAKTHFRLQPTLATSPPIAPATGSPVTRLPNGEWVITFSPFDWAPAGPFTPNVLSARPHSPTMQPVRSSLHLEATAMSPGDPWIAPFPVGGEVFRGLIEDPRTAVSRSTDDRLMARYDADPLMAPVLDEAVGHASEADAAGRANDPALSPETLVEDRSGPGVDAAPSMATEDPMLAHDLALQDYYGEAARSWAMQRVEDTGMSRLVDGQRLRSTLRPCRRTKKG